MYVVVLPTCAMIHCPPCPFHIAGLRWIPSSGGRVADIEPSTRTKAAGFRVGQGSPKIYWSRFRLVAEPIGLPQAKDRVP